MSSAPRLILTASLHDKVALVTGASRGIGRTCAIELGKRGCDVIVNYASSKDAAEEVVETIEANGTRAIAIQADVSNPAEIERLFNESLQAFGKLNIVLSNSGKESWDETEDVTVEKFDQIFHLNARAQFFVAQAAWKHLENDGRLILMSSISAGKLGIRKHALYSASKMAVIGMVKSFATDFGVRGIRVNGIAPGGVRSDMMAENAWHYIPGASSDWSMEKIEEVTSKFAPLGRLGEAEDVARVVAFLSSEDGGWVNGEVITIAGGANG